MEDDKKFSLDDLQVLIKSQNEKSLSKSDAKIIAQEVVKEMKEEWVTQTQCGKRVTEIKSRFDRKYLVAILSSFIAVLLAAQALSINVFDIIRDRILSGGI